MQIKVDFLCRDSDFFLAAPIVLDLVLFLDLAQRDTAAAYASPDSGVAKLLYFKSPMLTAPGLYPEHDLFIQLIKLKEHAAAFEGRRADYTLGAGVLRLSGGLCEGRGSRPSVAA